MTLMQAEIDADTGANGAGRDMEDRLKRIFEDKQRRHALGAYTARTDEQVEAGLSRLLAAHGLADHRVSELRRMAGGASKEQFSFLLSDPASNETERLVLRMDPRGGIIETCRRREAQVMIAADGVVPVPGLRFVDGDGIWLGQPAMITRFVGGVTKPSGASVGGPSGVGTHMGSELGAKLAPQFIDNLVRIHAMDFRAAALEDYTVPAAGTREAALFQANYWAMVWRDDRTDSAPIFAYAETWLREHAPVCDRPVLLHGDYRVGNFLFDEASGQMTALLDWELAHIGDFHEDIAYNFELLFGVLDGAGNFRIGDMFSEEEYVRAYEQASGRTVDPVILHYYRVLTCFKLGVMNHASAVRAARDGINHQDALLSWLSACAHGIMRELCLLLAEDFQ
jgi:aminoglycoside phosphotransferase (APT) family kinase protein